MKFEKIDHITIYVKELEKARKFFSELFEAEFGETSESPGLDVRSSMGPVGIELIEALTPDGPVAKAINDIGEGLHLVSLKVPNFEEAVAEMQAKGVRLAAIVRNANGKTAVFHPRDTYGVMFEFVGD